MEDRLASHGGEPFPFQLPQPRCCLQCHLVIDIDLISPLLPRIVLLLLPDSVSGWSYHTGDMGSQPAGPAILCEAHHTQERHGVGHGNRNDIGSESDGAGSRMVNFVMLVPKISSISLKYPYAQDSTYNMYTYPYNDPLPLPTCYSLLSSVISLITTSSLAC